MNVNVCVMHHIHSSIIHIHSNPTNECILLLLAGYVKDDLMDSFRYNHLTFYEFVEVCVLLFLAISVLPAVCFDCRLLFDWLIE